MIDRLDLRSDNTAPAHPAVLAAMTAANSGSAGAYGDDRWTARASEWLRTQFGVESESFLVWNGTGANVSALRAMTRPWQAVITPATAHIVVDECGAPELLAGIKLIDLPTPDGRLTVEQVKTAGSEGVGFEHHVQPRVVSISQVSEYGTVYDIETLTSICDAAHQLGLLVHMDGARLANAAASLGASLRAVSVDAGADVVSFGLTKNGAVAAEAVVFADREVAREFRYIRKQGTQLASKMRYLAAQFLALAEDDLWLANAEHANAMARRLADGVRNIAGLAITQPVEANAIFVKVPERLRAVVDERSRCYTWDEATGELRWMTSWATRTEAVDEFVAALTAAAG